MNKEKAIAIIEDEIAKVEKVFKGCPEWKGLGEFGRALKLAIKYMKKEDEKKVIFKAVRSYFGNFKDGNEELSELLAKGWEFVRASEPVVIADYDGKEHIEIEYILCKRVDIV